MKSLKFKPFHVLNSIYMENLINDFQNVIFSTSFPKKKRKSICCYQYFVFYYKFVKYSECEFTLM